MSKTSSIIRHVCNEVGKKKEQERKIEKRFDTAMKKKEQTYKSGW